MTTLEIFEVIKNEIAAIALDATNDPQGEKLFEAVELYPSENLGRALQELLINKSRACLLVPLAIRRVVNDRSGALSVMGRKYAEIAILYTDKAYFKPSQVVTFGGAKNLGLFNFDEKIEEALTGKEITPFGGIVLGDSDPLVLTDLQQKDAAGRQAWLIQGFVPVGLIAAAVD